MYVCMYIYIYIRAAERPAMLICSMSTVSAAEHRPCPPSKRAGATGLYIYILYIYIMYMRNRARARLPLPPPSAG